jgi:hypothetical protein
MRSLGSILGAAAVLMLLCRPAALGGPPPSDPEAVEKTVARTERLLVMLDSPDPARQVAVARLISERLPPVWFEGRGPVMGAYATAERRDLSRAAWRVEFAPEVRAVGRALLHRTSVQEAAVGATLLVFLGTRDDLPAITEAMTRFIDATRNPESPSGYMPPAFDPFLAASQAATYRGAEPVADPKTTGEIAVYLGKLSTHREWNPPGWRARMAEWRSHPSSFIRHISAPPYPLGRD